MAELSNIGSHLVDANPLDYAGRSVEADKWRKLKVQSKRACSPNTRIKIEGQVSNHSRSYSIGSEIFFSPLGSLVPLNKVLRRFLRRRLTTLHPRIIIDAVDIYMPDSGIRVSRSIRQIRGQTRRSSPRNRPHSACPAPAQEHG